MVILRFGPEEVTSLEGVDEEADEGEEPEGEGTGSTELSDIRLLGRCGRQRGKDRERCSIRETQGQAEDGGYINGHPIYNMLD